MRAIRATWTCFSLRRQWAGWRLAFPSQTAWSVLAARIPPPPLSLSPLSLPFPTSSPLPSPPLLSPPLPSPQQRSDVLGCNLLEGSGNVVVVDTNNLPGEGVFDNQLDDPDEQVTNLMAIMCSDILYTCIIHCWIQDDIIPGTTEFENGRLSCT